MLNRIFTFALPRCLLLIHIKYSIVSLFSLDSAFELISIGRLCVMLNYRLLEKHDYCSTITDTDPIETGYKRD